MKPLSTLNGEQEFNMLNYGTRADWKLL